VLAKREPLRNGDFLKKKIARRKENGIWHCAAVLLSQVPKKCTEPDRSLLYILIYETYCKFTRKNNFIALGVCFPQLCSITGRRLAAATTVRAAVGRAPARASPSRPERRLRTWVQISGVSEQALRHASPSSLPDLDVAVKRDKIEEDTFYSSVRFLGGGAEIELSHLFPPVDVSKAHHISE